MSESPTKLLLDVSRTIARSRLPAPTGIDRVERAYIQWAALRGAHFLAAFDGTQYLLEAEVVRALLAWMEEGGPRPDLDLRGRMHLQRDVDLRAAQSLVRRMSLDRATVDGLTAMLGRHVPKGAVYLNVGHDNLDIDLIDALGALGMYRVILIHDTIPLDHPEFARRGSSAKFQAKLAAALRADVLIANSQDTADHLRLHGAERPIVVAPLGIESLRAEVVPPPRPPVFVALGTIEPRKNHALLLEIWSQLGDELGASSPHLIVLGRRGWESEAVFRILDTSPMMGRTVFEQGAPDDGAISAALARATALLFPSHAEGYGLPLAEALDAGVPCIASDLPALREVGGSVPEYLAPDDVAGWRDMILEYARDAGQQRTAQLARMTVWQKPTWDQHFDTVENAIETILVQAENDG